ncbi:MAG: Uma2 family endonuclease [Saprospiraceae bacterium]|nr:Uma2 family endonuclease [Saprospiraceae bacterium]
MVAAPIQKKRYSLEEYFEMEEKSEEKHEFHNGKIILMPGGSVPHSKIAVNITSILNYWIEANNLPFYVLNSDTKVRIEHFNRNVYPDVLVVCEKPQYWKGRTDIIVNPTIVFEVFSNSTREYDRDGKFNLYRSCPPSRNTCLLTSSSRWWTIISSSPTVTTFGK